MNNKDAHKYTGYFITLEGADGSGKSTIASKLYDYYTNKNIKVLLTREPGGIRISEKIRDIILNPDHKEMDARTEALLYAAARSQHLSEKVIPALKEGYVVICDRFVDSSLAYQGFGRELGMEPVWSINEFAMGGYTPDLTLLFELDPAIGLKRINKDKDREVNRLDLEKHSFHYRVNQGYEVIKESFKERMELIDANQDVENVFNQCVEAIDEKLKTIQVHK